MSWLLPWALGAAAAAAAAVALLHLLAHALPPRRALPTARFVAAGTARATRRARTPRDRVLLLLRVLALALAGAAFAGPVLHPEGGRIARVVVLGATRGVGAGAALDSARARLRAGDRLVLLDSAAVTIAAGREAAALDSLRGMARDSTRPRDRATPAPLASGIIAAVRAASALDRSADSAALILVGLRGDGDASLASVRALWPGRADVVHVPARASTDSVSVAGAAVAVRGPSSDALVAGARLAGAEVAGARAGSVARGTLLVRAPATDADTAHVEAGGTLVVWVSDSAAGTGATVRAAPDTIGGFVAGGAAVLYAARRTHAPPAGRVVARWIDGVPAATERVIGDGCIRTVVAPIPLAGDLTLRPSFQRALRDLLAPCGGEVPAPLPDSVRALLAGSGPLARADALRAGSTRSAATPWLLGAALVLLLLEPLLRRPARASSEAAA